MDLFQVNEFISLRLEHGKTFIYLAGKKFNQCKSLKINIPYEEVSEIFSSINSVDEITKFNDESVKIPPSTEFWGHCSNLQIWWENSYNTNLLHSNLSFPLLRELTYLGDSVANRVYKEEIAKRLRYGSYNNQRFLFSGKYMDVLSSQELINGVLCPEEANVLLDISVVTKCSYKMIPSFDEEDFRYGHYNIFFSARDGHIIELELNLDSMTQIPKNIQYLPKLRTLHIRLYNNSNHHFKFMFDAELDSITDLKLFLYGPIEISDNFENLSKLEFLDIIGMDPKKRSSKFEKVPDSLCLLRNITSLRVQNIELREIPASINNLVFLTSLEIINTGLISIPASLLELDYVQNIDLSHNPLKITPEIEILERRFTQKIYKTILKRSINGDTTNFEDLKIIFNVPDWLIKSNLTILEINNKLFRVDSNYYIQS